MRYVFFVIRGAILGFESPSAHNKEKIAETLTVQGYKQSSSKGDDFFYAKIMVRGVSRRSLECRGVQAQK